MSFDTSTCFEMCQKNKFQGKLHSANKLLVNNIKILSFNVENLLPKLEDPDFLALINDHDICLFTETWLGSDEKIRYPGYWDFSQVRIRNNKKGRNSGGISIFVKKKIKTRC